MWEPKVKGNLKETKTKEFHYCIKTVKQISEESCKRSIISEKKERRKIIIMAMKSKVLIVGGTGYLGKRLVKASLAQGHETFVLHREEIGVDIEKVQMLLSFKQQGAHLVIGSFNDHQSLVKVVKLVDVVICAISGVHIRSHQILLQLKLVDAIKEAGNVKVLYYY